MSGGKIPPLFLYPSKFSISVNFSSNTFNATVLKDLTGGKRLKKQRRGPAPLSTKSVPYKMSGGKIPPLFLYPSKFSISVNFSSNTFNATVLKDLTGGKRLKKQRLLPCSLI